MYANHMRTQSHANATARTYHNNTLQNSAALKMSSLHHLQSQTVEEALALVESSKEDALDALTAGLALDSAYKWVLAYTQQLLFRHQPDTPDL